MRNLIKYTCLLLVLSSLFCCQTSRQGTEASSLVTTETLVPQDVAVAGSSVASVIDCDSLHKWLDAMKTNNRDSVLHDTIRIPDKSGKLVMKFYLDKMGNLITECEQKDKTVAALVKQLSVKQVDKSVVVKEIKRTPVWIWMVLGVSLFINLILGIYSAWKYFTTIL